MPRNIKTKGFAPASNLERHKAMHGLRSSSAAQPHTARPRRGTRAHQRRRAITEQY